MGGKQETWHRKRAKRRRWVTTGRGTVPINFGTEPYLLSGSIGHLRGHFHDTIVLHPTTFGMEGFAGKTETVRRCRCLYMPGVLPMPSTHFLSQTTCLLHLFHIAVISGMGRNSWVTTEQLIYLKSWLPLLPHAKGTIGLNTVYMQAYEGFLLKWQPRPVTPDPDMSPEQLETAAKDKLQRVRIKLPCFHVHSHPNSASSTGLRRSERRRTGQLSLNPSRRLVSLTCPASQSAKSPLTNSTRHSPFSTGSRRIPRSGARFRSFGKGETRTPCRIYSSHSSKKLPTFQRHPWRSWYSTSQ